MAPLKTLSHTFHCDLLLVLIGLKVHLQHKGPPASIQKSLLPNPLRFFCLFHRTRTRTTNKTLSFIALKFILQTAVRTFCQFN